MTIPRAAFLGLGIVLFTFLSGLPAAAESGSMGLSTNLRNNTTVVGQQFDIHVAFSYNDVAGDKIVCVRLKALYESDNSSINNSLGEIQACADRTRKSCSSVFNAKFTVAFQKEILPENAIQVDGYVRSRDSSSQHFLDTQYLRIKMVRPSRLSIVKLDCPQPPDTVEAGEPVPLVAHIQCTNLAEDNHVKIEIKDRNWGIGSFWRWSSPALSGSPLVVSDPIVMTFDKPGRQELQIWASSIYASTVIQDFDVEVVERVKRVIGPVRVDYPKPPQTVALHELVRFDVTMDYKDFPSGTVAAVVFVDPDTGKDLSQGWTTSRPLSGAGTYIFEGLQLFPPKVGTWNLDVALRLPKRDRPDEYMTAWTKRVSLEVVAPQGPTSPADPFQMKASIEQIQRPSGTLRVGETAPIVVKISYSKLGDAGTTLMAMITEKGTNIFAGRGDSIPLKKDGLYTFPPITVKAAHNGDWPLLVEIHGPAGRLLASKWFSIAVVD